jgi:hypothetical protein
VFAYAGGTLPGSPLDTRGYPSAAVATVTVVNPTAAGNLVVWGGAGTFPQSSALNFSAGQTIANTTVIPWGGRVSAGVEDFTVRYNGPSGQADVVVDVVGFFVQNTATALDCVLPAQFVDLTSIPNVAALVLAPSCGTGFTRTSTLCVGASDGIYLGSVDIGFCTFINNSGATHRVYVYSNCCRVPGQ